MASNCGFPASHALNVADCHTSATQTSAFASREFADSHVASTAVDQPAPAATFPIFLDKHTGALRCSGRKPSGGSAGPWSRCIGTEIFPCGRDYITGYTCYCGTWERD